MAVPQTYGEWLALLGRASPPPKYVHFESADCSYDELLTECAGKPPPPGTKCSATVMGAGPQNTSTWTVKAEPETLLTATPSINLMQYQRTAIGAAGETLDRQSEYIGVLLGQLSAATAENLRLSQALSAKERELGEKDRALLLASIEMGDGQPDANSDALKVAAADVLKQLGVPLGKAMLAAANSQPQAAVTGAGDELKMLKMEIRECITGLSDELKEQLLPHINVSLLMKLGLVDG